MSKKFIAIAVTISVLGGTTYGLMNFNTFGYQKISKAENKISIVSGDCDSLDSKVILIAQKYGGDPHGPDPHGDDPHDENHDSQMPANKAQKENKATKDVYGNQYNNSQQPY
ncbi:MAG: hypothetical protein K8F91_02905 [Candidatus Obscuribacterales bacterium]|nr:hypothetical protein [Candidatus Obscuribacterales bacterium]